ncbi:MAG: HEAT repeat domain-containing protein [Planctomycetota bacterium]
MALKIAKPLLCSAVALVAAALLPAQDFAEGVKQYRLGRYDEALQTFRAVLAADPTNEEAFEIFLKTDQQVWAALLQDGEDFRKIAQHMLDHATLGRSERSRDEDAIRELVDQATSDGDFGTRRGAVLSLTADHGEFAVPALVEKLGDTDSEDAQVKGIVALYDFGRTATLPLLEVLASDDTLLRRNVVAVLGHVKDERAVPALARLTESDSSDAVREAAATALRNIGGGSGSSAVVLYKEAAERFLSDSGVRGTDRSEVIWSWVDGALVAQDVPVAVYNFELAKKFAHAAVDLDPVDRGAKVLLARAYLGEAAAITESVASGSEDEALSELAAWVPALQNVAAATGLDVLRSAAADSMDAGMVPMAVAAIELLGDVETGEDLASSPLVAAVDNRNKRVAYSAALALAKAGGATPPAANRVVSVLGSAVQEETLLNVKVIDQSPVTERAAAEASFARGTAIDVSDSAADAMNDLYQFPNVDVVVLNENIADALPEAIIGLVQKNPRMQHIKVLVVTNDPDAAAERYGDRIAGAIAGPVSGESLRQAVEEALADVEPDALRARADKVAVAAGQALANLAANNVNVGGALGDLAGQLGRTDAIAIPVAMALGSGGTEAQIGALLEAIQGADASVELKVACADAIGDVLARSGGVAPDLFQALLAVAQTGGDAALRSAAVRALAKGNLDPASSLELLEALRVAPGAASGDDVDSD